MGEVELNPLSGRLIIRSVLFFYGDAANDALSFAVAKDIERHWNEAYGRALVKGRSYAVVFDIVGIWSRSLQPAQIHENTNPRNNYFRIEEFARGNISFVDGVNSNTGYFKLENLLNGSTTAAHEYGHSIGLDHPADLDIRGQGAPGIMYPRGTWVDAPFQYYPQVQPGEEGGTLNPFKRKVLQSDIDQLGLHRLDYSENGFAVLGDFTSVWHDRHRPG
jgi:hypothetical protein